MTATRALRDVDLDFDPYFIDLFLMANSNHLVCSFESSSCKLAYELRLATRVVVSDMTETVSFDGKSWNFFGLNQIQIHGRTLERLHKTKSKLSNPTFDEIFVTDS